MTQITQAKLKELNVLQLYEHYGALERSLPLLTPESQELAKAELEACAHLRSEKIDNRDQKFYWYQKEEISHC